MIKRGRERDREEGEGEDRGRRGDREHRRQRLTGNIPPVISSIWVAIKYSIQKENVFSSGLWVTTSPASPKALRLSLTDLINWMFPAVDLRYLVS